MSAEHQAALTVVSEFVPLVSREPQPSGANPIGRRNIIKAHEVTLRGTVVVERAGTSPSEPTVLVHREGDAITAIEFRCACGNSAAVRLDYGGE